MKVAIGNDHAAVELKFILLDHLADLGVEVANLGVDTEESVDYPDIAEEVARAVAGGEADLGVIVCGTGLGVCMAANKVRGIRAAKCSYEYEARMAREHNFANVCCLGSRVTGSELAKAIVTAFLATPVSAEDRHLQRCRKIDAIDDCR